MTTRRDGFASKGQRVWKMGKVHYSRILTKMGYISGESLGRGGGGIVNPVKAVHFTSFIKSMYNQLNDKPVEDDSEEEETAPTRQWKKSNLGAEGKTKLKYTYKTVDELLVLSNKQQIRDCKALKLNSNVKVIDLTGKEKRTFSSYEQEAYQT